MKQRYVDLLSIVIMSFMLIAPVYATPSTTNTVNIDQSKREDIKKLLLLMNSKQMGKQVLTQMISQFQKMQPNIPKEFWNQFMNDKSMDSLIDLTIPIYAKHLSHEDIKGLIQFYQTPLGKRFITNMPLMTQESMQAGQQWGQNLAMKIMQALKQNKSLPKK